MCVYVRYTHTNRHTHTDGERAQKGEKETKKLSDFKRVRSTGKKKGVCFYVFVGL